jgi:putative MFS transporter
VGRRRAFGIAVVSSTLLTAAAGFAQDLSQLIALRTIAGFGIGGVFPVAQAYITEYLPEKWRGKFNAWAHASVSLSVLVSSAVGILIVVPFGWRYGYLIGAVPAIFGLLAFVGVIPESVRYLVQKGRLADAERTIARVERAVLGAVPTTPSAQANGKGAPRDTPAPTALPPTMSMLEAFKAMLGPGNRAATLTLIPIWSFPWLFSMSAFNTVLLPTRLGITLSDVMAAMGAASIVSLLANAVTGAIVDVIGRRRTIYLALLPWAIAPWCQYNLAHDVPSLTAFFALGNFGLYMHSSAMMAYSPELLPSAIRSTGMGVCWSIFRLTTTLTPLFVGALLAITQSEPNPILYANFVATVSVIALVWLFGRERRGSLGEEYLVSPTIVLQEGGESAPSGTGAPHTV